MGFLDRRRVLAAALCGLLAVAISAFNLPRVSLWVDEAYTVTVATRSPTEIWVTAHNIDAVHSLYNLLMHPWLTSVGVNEWSVRLPSLISVGFAAAFLFLLVARLTNGTTALLAAMVFALLPRATWMAIEGRSYAFTTLLAVIATTILVEMVLQRRPSWAVAYALVIGLAISVNIYLVLLLGAHGVSLLVSRARFTRLFWAWFVSALAGFLGGSYVLVLALQQSSQIGSARADPVTVLRNVLVNQWFLGGTPTVAVSGGKILGTAADGLWAPAAVALSVLCWLLIAKGQWAMRRDSWDALDVRAVFLSWLLVPTILAICILLLGSSIYNPRYLAFCSPAVAACVSVGIVSLRRLPSRMIAVACIVALAAPVYISQRGEFAKSGADWSRIADFARAHGGRSEAVYFAPREADDGVGQITTTSRIAAVLYPNAFDGMIDVTLVNSPAQDGNLVGTSSTLAEGLPRLHGVDSLLVIRRSDYLVSERVREDSLLAAEGFRPGPSWTGPLNNITQYLR
jgi:mannosyltransferase